MVVYFHKDLYVIFIFMQLFLGNLIVYLSAGKVLILKHWIKPWHAQRVLPKTFLELWFRRRGRLGDGCVSWTEQVLLMYLFFKPLGTLLFLYSNDRLKWCMPIKCLNLPDGKINKVGNSKSQGNDASIMLKQSPCLTHQSKVIQQRSPVMVSITAPQLYLKINFQHLCFRFSFLLKLTMLSGFSAWAIWGVNMTSEK